MANVKTFSLGTILSGIALGYGLDDLYLVPRLRVCVELYLHSPNISLWLGA